MKLLILLAVASIFHLVGFSQVDTAFIAKLKSLDTAITLKVDTATVPEDELTRKIRLLRKEKGGFTIETIIGIKIAEEREKDTVHSKEFYNQLTADFTSGKTAKLIDNCMVNLYRRNFSEPEIDDLLRFSKTSAGKKMDREFILLMVQSVKDAELLMKQAFMNLEKKGVK